MSCSAGQFDAQDGPGSVEAWTTNLDWAGKADFFKAKRHIWRMGQDTSKFLQDDDHAADPALNVSEPEPDRVLQLAQYSHANDADRRTPQPVVGYWKHHNSLTTVVLKDAGHMVPRDQPLVTQAMIEAWVQHSLDHRWH